MPAARARADTAGARREDTIQTRAYFTADDERFQGLASVCFDTFSRGDRCRECVGGRVIAVVVIETVRQRAVEKSRVTGAGLKFHAPHSAVAGADVGFGKFIQAIADLLPGCQNRNTQT